MKNFTRFMTLIAVVFATFTQPVMAERKRAKKGSEEPKGAKLVSVVPTAIVDGKTLVKRIDGKNIGKWCLLNNRLASKDLAQRADAFLAAEAAGKVKVLAQQHDASTGRTWKLVKIAGGVFVVVAVCCVVYYLYKVEKGARVADVINKMAEANATVQKDARLVSVINKMVVPVTPVAPPFDQVVPVASGAPISASGATNVYECKTDLVFPPFRWFMNVLRFK